MKKRVRMLTCLMALLMLVGVFVGCKQEDAKNPNDNTQTESPEVLTGEALDNLPTVKNYENYEFVLLSNMDTRFGIPTFVVDEGSLEQGEAIPSALYDRASLIKEKYNVNLSIITPTDYPEVINNNFLAQSYLCDVINLHVSYLMPAAMQGTLLDINDYRDTINLDASYWDQRIQENLAVGDMLFTLTGDLNFGDELGTLITIYNKKLWDDKGFNEAYGTPYEMVKNHTWTYDNMMQMIKDFSEDTNGDDLMDERDKWGMISELTATYYFFIGSGLKIINNHNGELDVRLTDSTQYALITEVLEETITLGDNPDVVFVNDPNPFTDMSDVRATENRMFTNDQALFNTYIMGTVLNLKDMKSDFGILPIPAYFEDQTEYHCWVNGGSSIAAMSMYRYTKDAQRTAEIMEILSYHSRHGSNTLYEALFERMKYARVCRSEDDLEMFDIIIDSKAFDFDQAAAISGIEGQMYSLSKWGNADTLHSTLENSPAVTKAKLNKWVMTVVKNCP